VPAEDLIWQDPVPAQSGALVTDAEIADLKKAILHQASLFRSLSAQHGRQLRRSAALINAEAQMARVSALPRKKTGTSIKAQPRLSPNLKNWLKAATSLLRI